MNSLYKWCLEKREYMCEQLWDVAVLFVLER